MKARCGPSLAGPCFAVSSEEQMCLFVYAVVRTAVWRGNGEHAYMCGTQDTDAVKYTLTLAHMDLHNT